MRIVFVKGLSQADSVFGNQGWLIVISSTLDNATEVLEQLDNFPAFWIVQAVRSLCIWLEVSLAQDRLDTSISILDVRTCFSLERNHSFQIKVVTIAAVSFEVVELNCSYPNCTSNSFLVFQIWVFSFNLALSPADSFQQSWFEEDDISFTCRQFLMVLSYQSEVNVNHVIAPVKAHLFQNGLELSEVVGLLLTYNIDIFDKVVSASSVDGCCNITCDVEGSTV